MLGYTIKDLETLTGIKAHTIRIWERRYNIVKPRRTASNIRYYSESDLKRLLNVAILNKQGIKISKIANLSDAVLIEKVLNICANPNDNESQIEALVVAMIELDDKKFEKVILDSTIKRGFEETIIQVIYPFFERTGLLWQTGSVNAAQEHFVSNLLRQKLIVAIDGQMAGRNPNAKRFMLFLPENEYNELSLLFFSYLLRKHGHKTLYLGQSISLEDLFEVGEIKKPEFLITGFTKPWRDNGLELYLWDLSKRFSDATIFISGSQCCSLDKELPSNVIKLNDTAELKKILEQYD